MKKIIAQEFHVSKEDRNHLNGHNSLLLWFTGLSGSGKSTLANLVETELYKKKIRTFSLDGDNLRMGLNKDLKFSPEDRKENIRRTAETAKLFLDSGAVVLASFISPFTEDREKVKEIVGAENFVEIFVNASLEECERRDVKGLYKRARAGKIKNFTGISSPYEKPENPDIEVKTEEEKLEEAVKRIILNINEKLEIRRS